MLLFFVMAAKAALLPGAVVVSYGEKKGYALLAALAGILFGAVTFLLSDVFDGALEAEFSLFALGCLGLVALLVRPLGLKRATLAALLVGLIAGFQLVEAILLAAEEGQSWLQTRNILQGLSLFAGLLTTGVLVIVARPAWAQLPGFWHGVLRGCILLLLALYLGGGLYYLLLRLEFIELTRWGLAFVARLSHHEGHFAYVLLGLLLLPVFRWPQGGAQGAEEATSAGQRLLRAHKLQRRQALVSAYSLSLMAMALFAWQDVWASRSPRISDATPITLAEDGTVRLPIEAHADGRLHRYAFTTEDGRVVRFFLINRYDDRTRLGVVFDACMLCGDDGYLQKKSQIICISCGVHIHRPSIGKAGGCNPIPLAHTLEEGMVVIRREALDEAAQLFSTVVAVEVTDPVSGDKLINLEAPCQYEWKGRTYFFVDEAHRAAFRDDPQAYLGAVSRRRTRVDGYPADS